MTTLYADRAFISVNGARIADVQSATMKRNFNAKPVPSMTPDSFNRGFVRGNQDIDITVTIAVQSGLARPKLGSIDYAASSVQITYLVGNDQYVATGVFLKDDDINAGGVGEEVKSTYNFGALKLVDATGNSALFSIQL
jgi:hypothetical protein